MTSHSFSVVPSRRNTSHASERTLLSRIDEVFENEDFASLYDNFNAWAQSDEFYRQLARESGGPVLDLGCGTGMLACRIAQDGLSITGADPAEGMLRVARARPGSGLVTWVKAAGQKLCLPARFKFIYMTGHAFQALLTDEDAVAVLKNVFSHLSSGGHFAFESRNPARRAWLDWTPDKRKLAVIGNQGRVEEFFNCQANTQTGIVDIVHHYQFLDTAKVITGRSRLRFVDQEHLTNLLTAACLVPIAWYGDWDGTPLTPTSHEFIVVAGRAD